MFLMVVWGLAVSVAQTGNFNRNYKVDKEYDEDGNITHYDSVMVESNIPGINADNIDSLINSMHQQFGIMSTPGFNHPFFDDNFWGHSFPQSRHQQNPQSDSLNEDGFAIIDTNQYSVPLHRPSPFPHTFDPFGEDFGSIFENFDKIHQQHQQMIDEMMREMEEFHSFGMPNTPPTAPQPNQPPVEEKQPHKKPQKEETTIDESKIFNI